MRQVWVTKDGRIFDNKAKAEEWENYDVSRDNALSTIADIMFRYEISYQDLLTHFKYRQGK